MPNQHRYRAITPRPPDDLRAKVQDGVTVMGTSINAIVIAFLRWYARETDELPERPEAKD